MRERLTRGRFRVGVVARAKAGNEDFCGGDFAVAGSVTGTVKPE